MVLGYICNEHGYQSECDVSEAGERLCYECGNAVTGLTGTTRGRNAPPSDRPRHQQGSIRWDVSLGYSAGRSVTVEAFGYEEAVEAAIERIDDDPQEIRRVRPARREYRR